MLVYNYTSSVSITLPTGLYNNAFDSRLKTSDAGLVTFAALMGAPAVVSEKCLGMRIN